MGRPKKKVTEAGATLPLDLETRGRILKAAEELFVSRGYKGVSMKDVALVVEITPAALYYHFPAGKTGLFLDVVKNVLEELAAGMTAAAASGQDIRAKLTQFTLYFLNSSTSSFPILMRDVEVQIKDEQQKKQVWEHHGHTYIKAVDEVFRAAAAANEITDRIPTRVLASLYMGMNFSLLHNPKMQTWRTDEAEAKRLAQTIVAVLLDGIRK